MYRVAEIVQPWTPSQSDVISVNETHLPGNNKLMPNPLNFQCIWYNCTTKNRKSPHNFGRVGFLINKQIMQVYTVEICGKTVDGLLAIMLENKYTTYKIMIMTCYIPPENSIYGRDSSVQLDQIEHIVEIYSQKYNVLYVMDGFNAKLDKFHI